MKVLLATLTLWTAAMAQNRQNDYRNQRFDPQQHQANQRYDAQQHQANQRYDPQQHQANQRYEPQQQQPYQNYQSTPETPKDAQPFQADRQDPYITPVPIIRLSKQMSLDGSYKSSYETGNSIVAEESGFLRNFGVQGQDGIVQYGTYSYTDPEGRLITVKYTADEGGFRAEGEHLPTPPPVPPEVQKGLDIIFESIKQRQVQEAEFRKNGAESANFPPEDDGSYKPHLYQ